MRASRLVVATVLAALIAERQSRIATDQVAVAGRTLIFTQRPKLIVRNIVINRPRSVPPFQSDDLI